MTGPELRRRRLAVGLTQSGVAQLIRVSKNTVARWERGEMRITAPMAMLIDLVLPKRPARRRKDKRG
jgi:transcriptional regulator with XRE-family HTH domain